MGNNDYCQPLLNKQFLNRIFKTIFLTEFFSAMLKAIKEKRAHVCIDICNDEHMCVCIYVRTVSKIILGAAVGY